VSYDLTEAMAKIDDAEQAALKTMGIITGPTPNQMMRQANIASIGRDLPNWMSTTNSAFPLWVKPEIHKVGKRWKVTHQCGGREFKTWKKAKGYALAPVELVWEDGRCPNAGNLCNCIGLCQPKRVYRIKGRDAWATP
jgi:hypothetical protein